MEAYQTEAFWKELAARRRAEEKKWNRASLVLGLGKLALVVTVFLTVYFLWLRGDAALGASLTALQLVLFLAACIAQAKCHARERFEGGMAVLAEKNLARLGGSWGEFPDTGEELAGPEHEYARDLDVVGRRSLFQLLNSTGTPFGRRRFAGELLGSVSYGAPELCRRQQAAAELAAKPEWCCELELLLAAVGTDDALSRAAERLADGEGRLRSGAARAACRALRLLTCAALVLGVFLPAPYGTAALAAFSALFVVQIAVWGVTFPRVRPFLASTAAASRRVSACAAPVEKAAREPFECEKLRELSDTLGGAIEPLRGLSKIARRVGLGNGSILGFVLNGLFLWDLWNAAALDRWKRRWGAQSVAWFEALGELESLLSLANLPRCCEGVCLPSIAPGTGVFRAEALGHPLLPNGARVCSDFDLAGGIHIVSGSNMAGKTTFLRTVGVNMVLARAGGFVCARSLVVSPMRVMTSMRLTDDLSGRISTFYAELQRVKSILDAAQRDKTVLFLIDEIFRGTNSVDRLVGAQAVLRRLEALGVSGMITTHDLEICRLAEETPRVVNSCFCETYHGDEIEFDYKRRDGVAKTTNGRFLLRKIGILEP